MHQTYPAPYESMEPVTPDDDTDLPVHYALFVGTGGNLSVLTLADEEVAINSVPSGTTLQIRVKRVRASGTTASNITALRE